MAEAYYTIPLKACAQRFGITLAGREYRLTVRWFDAAEGGWCLDIDQADGAASILAGIPLVTGCDLFEQYAHLGFGGELWVEGELPPTPDNLGSEVELVFTVWEDEA